MSSKLTLSGLKKRLGNIEKRQDDLGCNKTFIPLYNGLECDRLAKSNERTKKEIELKASAAKKAATAKKAAAAKKVADGEKAPRRPRGRPPMPCEDIAKKVLTKDAVKKQALVERKCAKRASNSFPGYRCMNVNGKCTSGSKV